MHLSLPEWLLLLLLLSGLLLHARDHGKPKKGTENFWVALFACFVQFGLMYWAGLFR